MGAKAFDFHRLKSSCGKDKNSYGIGRLYSEGADSIVATSIHIILLIKLLMQTLLPRNRGLLEVT